MCENLGDHIVGHVYIKFEDEENAAEALQVGAQFARGARRPSNPDQAFSFNIRVSLRIIGHVRPVLRGACA